MSNDRIIDIGKRREPEKLVQVSIDPGINSGVAIFVRDTLEGVALLEGKAYDQAQGLMKICNTLQQGFPIPFRKAFIEVPKVYPQRSWKGDPNDLITVALVGGWLGHVLSFYLVHPNDDLEYIYPQTWKGNRPKDIDNELTMGLLSGPELKTFGKLRQPKSKIHNVIDAVGIGLYGLQRR